MVSDQFIALSSAVAADLLLLPLDLPNWAPHFSVPMVSIPVKAGRRGKLEMEKSSCPVSKRCGEN